MTTELVRFQDNFSDDFLQGQRDCKIGISHEHKTEAYNRGYATQYAMEQTLTERTRKQNEY